MRPLNYRRPSPAMLVSFVALLVALGGTSYAAITLPANSVGTKQLKKSAVTGKKVKNRSLKAVDFALGQLPRGPQAVQGVQGPQGPAGATGATNVTVRGGAEETGTSTASCQTGERAVGGGGISSNGVLYNTTPSEVSGTPTAWEASAVTGTGTGTGTAADVQAWVVCAAP